MRRFSYPEIGETVFRETLPCGLQIAVIPRKGFARRIAYLVTGFGSIHTQFELDGKSYTVPAGTAHYLEHRTFSLPGKRDVEAEFAALGASVNAFTGYDMTAYYFSCTENFEKALRLLIEFVMTPYFTQEGVARERGIIQQEVDMNLDSPDSVIYDNLMEILYENHPVRMPILGTGTSIQEITPEILLACHHAFYRPENMLLCVIGDESPACIVQAAAEAMPVPEQVHVKKKRFPSEKMNPKADRTACRMEIAMPTFHIAFKCEPLPAGDDAIRQEMIADLAAEALMGESSELYLRLYEEGLIDSSFGGEFETMDGCAMLCASGDSMDPEAVRDAIIEEASRLAERGIDEASFTRLLRSEMGQRIRGLDNMDGTCFRVCAYHCAGFDYFRFPEIYREITAEDICRFLRRVVARERCAISVIYPLKEEECNESC